MARITLIMQFSRSMLGEICCGRDDGALSYSDNGAILIQLIYVSYCAAPDTSMCATCNNVRDCIRWLLTSGGMMVVTSGKRPGNLISSIRSAGQRLGGSCCRPLIFRSRSTTLAFATSIHSPPTIQARPTCTRRPSDMPERTSVTAQNGDKDCPLTHEASRFPGPSGFAIHCLA